MYLQSYIYSENIEATVLSVALLFTRGHCSSACLPWQRFYAGWPSCHNPKGLVSPPGIELGDLLLVATVWSQYIVKMLIM